MGVALLSTDNTIFQLILYLTKTQQITSLRLSTNTVFTVNECKLKRIFFCCLFGICFSLNRITICHFKMIQLKIGQLCSIRNKDLLISLYKLIEKQNKERKSTCFFFEFRLLQPKLIYRDLNLIISFKIFMKVKVQILVNMKVLKYF